ncbi:MAG: hypothetical protein KAH07_08140 [Flavobacteriaceae bacterium]|nr:hypothetical protein [Flavobacteriaceae bacterium]
MIKYIKRGEIDEEKYNACIGNAINSRIYAYSWYLDIVADNWDALVLNDYEAVMPLPWRRKYFIKYVYPPCWTQQLGVFSSDKISNELVQQFIKSIPRKFKKVTIQFNSGNPIAERNVTERINYVLDLNKPYEELVKGYNKLRKRQIKKNRISRLKIENCLKPKLLIDLFKAEEKYEKMHTDKDFEKLEKLMTTVEVSKKGGVVGCFSEGYLCGGLFYLNDSNRITYLFSGLNNVGRENNGMTLLINKIINENSGLDCVLDFEGSMNEGISKFFKSFGGHQENYYQLTQRVLL